MKLSNTATPKYYGMFRDAVMRGDIVVCENISLQMNRIDERIRDRRYYYDEDAVEGYIAYCNKELTLTDGSDMELLDTFKLWAEDLFAWFYYVEKEIYEPYPSGGGGRYVRKVVKRRLTNKQYVIVARGAAKTMYGASIQSYGLNVDTSTTHQITTAPTMKQSEEMLSPIRTAITRARGPLFKFLTSTAFQTVKSAKSKKTMLASTKKGIENFITGSLLEIKPMSVDKLQGLRCKYATVDEWLSGVLREDPIGAIEQGASKNDDWIIVAMSSEGTVRNGSGDTIKMELMDILTGKYDNPHVSIWWYKLDKIEEVNDPSMWVKAQPNIGKTVSYETYQLDVERAERVPSAANDILAKRFDLPMEGYTYFFTYEETIPHAFKSFDQMACSMGVDLSQGDDFCSFTFLFPLSDGSFGVKTRNYVAERSYRKLGGAMREKYQEFVDEGSLRILDGPVLVMPEVYDDLIEYIDQHEYDVRCVGYDPYQITEWMNLWVHDNGEYAVEKVIQGAKTESVPLGELKKYAEDKMLIFDEKLMEFAMGNCIVFEDGNQNRKLSKKRYEAKIDAVSAMMDAYVSFKKHRDEF